MVDGDAKARLREVGLRVTPARLELLDLLDRSEEPLSHGDAVELLGPRGGDPATTYRNLIRLVDVGLARVASTVGGITRFESTARAEHEHPHFHCASCGTTSCLPDTSVSPPRGRWRKAIQEAELTFVGTCPKCQGK